MYNKNIRGELIKGNKTFGEITTDILRPIESSAAPTWWYIAITLSSLAVLWGVYSIYLTI
jgi:hypothetical protein